MKNLLKLTIAAMFMFMGTTAIVAQETIEVKEVKVYGACGMCEKRIEKAATAVEGVTKADWDKETKMMKVVFDSKKTDLDKIQKVIAEVGHDTEKYTAEDAVYEKLHSCCKYERKAEHAHGHDHGDHGHKH